jgi:hypothetical protein
VSTIKPTIGRKVWYWPEQPTMRVNDDRQAFDATIVFVHDDGTVNLAVFDHDGHYLIQHRVELQDEPTRRGIATWMPYQLGQAAKERVTTETVRMGDMSHEKRVEERGQDADPCLAKRRPGEPMFTLLGRDPVAASLIRLWAAARERLVTKPTPPDRIADARAIAAAAFGWCTSEGHGPVDVLDLLPIDVLTAAVSRRGYDVRLVYKQMGEAQKTPGMQLQGSSLKPADDESPERRILRDHGQLQDAPVPAPRGWMGDRGTAGPLGPHD